MLYEVAIDLKREVVKCNLPKKSYIDGKKDFKVGIRGWARAGPGPNLEEHGPIRYKL